MAPQPPSPSPTLLECWLEIVRPGESSSRSIEPFCAPSARDSALRSAPAAPRCRALSGPRDASRTAGQANTLFTRAHHGTRMLCLNRWCAKLSNTVPAAWWAWPSTIRPGRDAAYAALPKWRSGAKRPSCLDLSTLPRKEAAQNPALLETLGFHISSHQMIAAAAA
jgi:hypothetical protein